MFRNRFLQSLKTVYRTPKRTVVCKIRNLAPTPLGLLVAVSCKGTDKDKMLPSDCDDNLSHEFLIRQATTVNVNAATQLLTVTVVAFQETSEKLRVTLKKEICLVEQAMELGDCTPKEHWDELIAVRHALTDTKHNLQVLTCYIDYADKLATTSAQISYLSGNVGASDAMCGIIDQSHRYIRGDFSIPR